MLVGLIFYVLMKKLYVCVIGVLLMAFVATDSFGQFNRRQIRRNNKRMATFTGKKRFNHEHVYSGVGLSLNALNYYGDLSPLPSKFSTDISFTKPAIGISFFHRFGPRYTLVGQFMYGTLKGSDAESAKGGFDGEARKLRNLSFRNRIKELSVTAMFDLFENQGTYISRVNWTPYVFAGAALLLQNPQAQAPATYLDGSTDPYAGKWVNLQPLGTEGQHAQLNPGGDPTVIDSNGGKRDVNYGIKPYHLLQVAIPFGIGARFRLNELFDLSADIGFRYTFTDYLDDVSKSYVDVGVFDPNGTFTGKNQLAQAMSYRSNEVAGANGIPTVARDGKTYNLVPGYGGEGVGTNVRGNKHNKDIYMVTSIKLTYILGATFHKAKFR